MRHMTLDAIFIFLLGLLCPACLLAQAANEPTIGLVLPLSGEWAFLGAGIRDGAMLAQQDLKSRGMAVRLIFEDNQGDLQRSASIGQKLASVNRVDALVSIISGVGRLLKPIAAQAQIINIGICSETEVADGQYSFINYLTAEQGVSKFIERFEKTFRPGAALGVYALNESGFVRIAQELKNRRQINVAFEQYFDKGTTDFRPLLLKRAAAKADALLLLGLSPEIETIVRQARSLSINTPVVSIEGFGLANDKSAFEGSWFIDSAVPHSEFRERFTKQSGREITPGAGHAYDSVILLAHAWHNAPDRGAARLAFRQIRRFPGVVGALDVRSDGIIWSDPSVKVIRNGRAELAPESTAGEAIRPLK